MELPCRKCGEPTRYDGVGVFGAKTVCRHCRCKKPHNLRGHPLFPFLLFFIGVGAFGLINPFAWSDDAMLYGLSSGFFLLFWYKGFGQSYFLYRSHLKTMPNEATDGEVGPPKGVLFIFGFILLLGLLTLFIFLREIVSFDEVEVGDYVFPLKGHEVMDGIGSIPSTLTDGEKTENRPSATASSCRLARTRRSRSKSVRRRAAQPQKNKTAGAKKEEETGSEKKANLPLQNSSSIDHKAAENLETEESKEMHVEENMNKASDADDGGAKEINVDDKNPAEIEKASACRPRGRSQRRAMATRSGNDVAAGRSTKSPSLSADTSSSSIDEAQSVFNSSAENGENNNAPLVAASTDSKVENNIQERKEKARRRAERARRLRALQN